MEGTDSPIEEVNLTVPTTDSPNMPVLTARTWIIGLLICSCLAFLNQFFWFRTSPITISALAGQIVTLYMGRIMRRWLPNKRIGSLELNPGPFNIKGACPYHRQCFFNKSLNFGVAVLLMATTQTLGYGMAGLLRKYVVRALHEKEPSKGLNRIPFFIIAAVVSFAWYLLPVLTFSTITSLSWMCWIFKDSVTAQQLGSGIRWQSVQCLTGGLDLDLQKYDAYGPPQLSASYAIIHWGLVFAYVTSAFTHVCLWNGNDIYNRLLKSRLGGKYKPDAHTRLMQKYPEIPSIWFWALLLVNTVLSFL
ncbi:hypothetical protein R1flu_005570 [Riccia fluitans]|uniref:Uncharacterized protein n=1 Tax=Riccia fluitans TaxID=41844 RepID=A0ABD1YTJ6_9MARC